METITEDYCSYEVAKLLKEKGFNEPCLYYYFSDGKIGKTKGLKDRNCPSVNTFSMPTHQMAMKWLREVHNISIEPFVDFGYGDGYWWGADIAYIKKNGLITTISIRKSYEETVEAALKLSLENLV